MFFVLHVFCSMMVDFNWHNLQKWVKWVLWFQILRFSKIQNIYLLHSTGHHGTAGWMVSPEDRHEEGSTVCKVPWAKSVNDGMDYCSSIGSMYGYAWYIYPHYHTNKTNVGKCNTWILWEFWNVAEISQYWRAAFLLGEHLGPKLVYVSDAFLDFPAKCFFQTARGIRRMQESCIKDPWFKAAFFLWLSFICASVHGWLNGKPLQTRFWKKLYKSW